jgi:hypothetical protein
VVTRWSPSRRAGARATPRGGQRGGGTPLWVRCAGQRSGERVGRAVEAWRRRGTGETCGAAEQFGTGESGH